MNEERMPYRGQRQGGAIGHTAQDTCLDESQLQWCLKFNECGRKKIRQRVHSQ